MTRRARFVRFAIVAGAGTALSAGLFVSAGAAPVAAARPDHYRIGTDATLRVGGRGVFANDSRVLTTVVRHTAAAHGELAMQAGGGFTYTPQPGFTGTDSFTYTTSDAVHLYRTDLPPLATIHGVEITGGGYGSSFTRKPGSSTLYYGLTDRGPNVDGPDGTKVEPLPDFDPAIGEFKLVGGRATLVRRIPLTAPDAAPYDGRTNCAANTLETITDLNGTVLPCSDTGYDSEGLAVLRDGTFWVSDEYGPFITHFDRSGRQIARLSPFDHSLPRELAYRVPNKGMEGLSVTPDGSTLVGIMQSALQTPDLTAKYKSVAPLRIVTIDLRTGAMHEYLYLLHDPARTSSAVSEITALSDTRFLVDERDGNVEPGAFKRLYEIDLTGATDVGPAQTVRGARYDPLLGGLLLTPARTSIEQTVGAEDTAAARATLDALGVHPVHSQLRLDVGGLVTHLDPSGGFFGHDKIEGVATTDHGRTLVLSNDSDFGIAGVGNDTPPFTLTPKLLPDGTQDDGEFLAVDTTRLPARTYTATVTIDVR